MLRTKAFLSSEQCSSVAWWGAAAAAELLIGIHVELTPMHLDEKFYVGVLFCVGNGLLLLGLLLMAGRRYRSVGWTLGFLVCLAEFGGFTLSRTVGLPGNYHEAWAAGTEDFLGLACLMLEATFMAAALLAWQARKRADPGFRPASRRTRGSAWDRQAPAGAAGIRSAHQDGLTVE